MRTHVLCITTAIAFLSIGVAWADSPGESTYKSSCGFCHDAGAAGAPKLGAASDWSARSAQGNDKLYEHSIKGFQGSKGFMPAKGGNGAIADADVKAAVDFMLSKVK
jgi:cytochrome c5